MTTALADRMRAYAARVDSATGERLIELAADLDAKTAGFYAEPQTVSVAAFVGAWTRARRLWREVTGEPVL